MLPVGRVPLGACRPAVLVGLVGGRGGGGVKQTALVCVVCHGNERALWNRGCMCSDGTAQVMSIDSV
jgi:hypothetical protein